MQGCSAQAHNMSQGAISPLADLQLWTTLTKESRQHAGIQNSFFQACHTCQLCICCEAVVLSQVE